MIIWFLMFSRRLFSTFILVFVLCFSLNWALFSHNLMFGFRFRHSLLYHIVSKYFDFIKHSCGFILNKVGFLIRKCFHA